MAESSPPPPPKHGGSGSFIAAAVVMLLLMGGLIYWKVSTNKPPLPPPPPPKVATESPPMLDEPPPPPPPKQKVEEAGTKKVVTRHHGTYTGGCGGICKGTVTSAVRAALHGRAGQTRGCYERALRQNAALKGRLVIDVRLGSRGQVCSASVGSNSLGNPAVAACVVQMFRTGKYPAPRGGCVNTAVPVNFVPKS